MGGGRRPLEGDKNLNGGAFSFVSLLLFFRFDFDNH
mgnify:CR=1 FL=1